VKATTPYEDGRPLSVLLLCDDWPGHANTVLDHIRAFVDLSRHRVSTYNPKGLTRLRALDLDEFDVVVLHYSLCIIVDHYVPPDLREKLRRYRGLKIQYIQDDYRWVDEITSAMRYVGIDVLFTLVPDREIPKIWDEGRLPAVVKINTLAGYVPEDLARRPVPPYEQRPIDIGYRGRPLPYWLGRIGQDKVRVAQQMLTHAPRFAGLRLDVGWRENDRIYGEKWIEFVSSCRANLGTESGASITDFDRSAENAVKAYLAAHPSADFDEIHRSVLEPYEGNVLVTCISPRMFEAAALRTGLILYPAEYSGILRPGHHYLPLEKDFSNVDDVVERFRDASAMKAMIDRTYDEIIRSGRYSYRAMADQFDEVVARYGRRHRRAVRVAFPIARLERHVLADQLGHARRGLQLAGRGMAAARLAMATPELRRLTAAFLRKRAWRGHGEWAGFGADVLRLTAIAEAQASRGSGGATFSLSCHVEPASDVAVLTSVADPAMAPRLGVAALPTAATAWEWDHSRVGTSATCSLPDGQRLVLPLGDLGRYRFEALSRLGRSAPAVVRDVFRAALAAVPVQETAAFRRAFERQLRRRRSLHRLLSSAPPSAAAFQDALCLAALCDASAAEMTVEPLVRVAVLAVEDGTVVIETCAWGPGVALAPRRAPGEAAAVSVGAMRVEWRHTGAGPVRFRVGSYWVALPVRAGTPYVFATLLGRECADRESAAAVIASIIRGVRPPFAWARRFRPRTLASIPRLITRLAVVLPRPSLRRVLRAALRTEARAHPMWLLEDLVRLRALQDACARARPPGGEFVVEPVFDAEPSTILLRSVAATSGTAVDALRGSDFDAPDRIVWDHSAVGGDVSVRSVFSTVHLSFEQGRYEFRTLPEVARRFPREVGLALLSGPSLRYPQPTGRTGA